MNADSIFQKGSEHVVCEDYAMSFSNETHSYAIVSDGCSSSNNVDIGSRLLTLAASHVLNETVGNTSIEDFKSNFENAIILTISKLFNVFPNLNQHMFDATLLIASVYNKKLTLILFGDGVIVYRSKKHVQITHINFPSNAPDYISYKLSKSRMKEYMDMSKTNKDIVVIDRFEGMDEEDFIFSESAFTPLVIQREVEEGDTISVISDGINSFGQMNDSINYLDLIDEFTGFKNTNGEFVKRRINAFKRKCEKENIVHGDDISIASIVI